LLSLISCVDECYANSFLYGPTCPSSISLIGSSKSYIQYSVEVKGSLTVVFCQGKGTGQYKSGNKCNFGWYDIGCLNKATVVLGWSSTIDTPAIRCYGLPFGSELKWSWTSGDGNINCPMYMNGNTTVLEDLWEINTD